MQKQVILQECGRRLGDTSTGFLTGPLSNAFNFVLLELAQLGCLSMLRRQNSYLFSNAACTTSNGLLLIDTSALLGLTQEPEDILNPIVVPAWGTPEGYIQKDDEQTFMRRWLGASTATGRPQYWRAYPNLSQLQLWPAPDADSLTATFFISWMAAPATLADNAEIAEVHMTDLPTVLAGLYRYGVTFRDETFNDLGVAEKRWAEGVAAMKRRQHMVQNDGKMNQIAYRAY